MRWVLCMLPLGGCGLQASHFPDPAVDLMARLDTDGSGSLSEDELVAQNPATALTLADEDGDGLISQDELRAVMERW